MQLISPHIPKASSTLPESVPEQNMSDQLPTWQHSIDLHGIMEAITRRRLGIALCMLATLALGLCWTFSSERQYMATAEIVISQQTPQSSTPGLSVVDKIEQLSLNTSLSTQIHQLRSPSLLLQAMQVLPKKIQYEGFRGIPTINVQPVGDAKDNIIGITVTAFTPQAAAALANSLTQAFIQLDLEENRKNSATALSYIEQELTHINRDLHEARQQLSNFEGAHGITDDDVVLSRYSENLSALHQQADQAKRDAAIAQGTMRSLLKKLNQESPEIISDITEEQNPIIDKVDMQLNDLEVQRLQLQQIYTPDAPEIKSVENQITAVKQRRLQLLATRVSEKKRSLSPIYQQLQQQFITASVDADTAEVRSNVLQQEIAQKSAQFKQLTPLQMRAAEMKSKVTNLAEAYDALSKSQQSMEINKASAISNVRTLQEASANSTPVSPNIPRNIALSLLAGLLLAIFVTVLAESFDNRIHTRNALEQSTPYPVLATIPPSRIGNTHDDAILEAMRLLRNSLALIPTDTPLNVIGITSPDRGDGKSTMAINLAIAIAMNGKRVVLVDGNLRHPTLHNYFNLPNTAGLTTLTASKASIDDTLLLTDIERVTLLPAGPEIPNAPEMLNAPYIHQVLKQLAATFDTIIIDTPAIVGSSDALSLVPVIDAFLMVVAIGKTTQQQLQESLHILRQVGAPILGLVTNYVKSSRRIG